MANPVPRNAEPEPRKVWLYNPLPEALRHYEAALVDVLSAAGVTARLVDGPSIEGLGTSKWRRAHTALVELAAHAQRGREPGHLVVCWPTYGLLEPMMWVPFWRGSTVSIIVHDPTPLRRQLGMGQLAAALGGRALGGRAARAPHVRVVIHSELAAQHLRRLGWADLAVVPHPVFRARARSVSRAADAGAVLVCGQFKPARNLRLLSELGPVLRRRGYRTVIAGRGWPTVAGWEVVEGFLSEAELDERVGSAAAVLLPYNHFYQSGIAVRAMELGVPVVGPDHPFLAELYGLGWPGLVDSGLVADWADAVAAVAAESQLLASAAAQGRARCLSAWAAYLGRIAMPTRS